MKNQIEQYAEPINRAVELYRKPGFTLSDNPYYKTSDNSDVFLLTCWALFWSGRPPTFIHKSRGYRWWVASSYGQPQLILVNNDAHHPEFIPTNEG